MKLFIFAALLVISFSTKAQSPLSSVTIGNQEWTSKNLDVSTYRNGDVIPQVTNPKAWAALTTGAWCWYNNDSTKYAATYGKLYNWYAVNDPRGLSPVGWHIPTDEEWTTLTDQLGALSVAGGAMKEMGTAHWKAPNTDATNSSGFTGLPGGGRFYNGPFGDVGYFGNWWSASESNTTFAWSRYLNYFVADASRIAGSKAFGSSVRCVRD